MWLYDCACVPGSKVTETFMIESALSGGFINLCIRTSVCVRTDSLSRESGRGFYESDSRCLLIHEASWLSGTVSL